MTGIKTLLQDAELLFSNGHYQGALLLALVSVSASSRRRYPQGTNSLKNPKQSMGDGEAFRLFLGAEIERWGGNCIPNPYKRLFVYFRGKDHLFEYVLYKWFRCELVHEADLPSDIEFVPDVKEGHFRISVEPSKLVVSYGVIEFLIKLVRIAKENSDLFPDALVFNVWNDG